MTSTIAPDTVTVATRDGVNLVAEIHGSGSRDLLLLHSLGTTAAVWHPLIPFLLGADPDLRVVAPEARNHGRSARTLEHTSFRDAVDDALDVIVGLGLRRPGVVGSSIGAGVALELAIRRPDLVRDVVVAGGAVHAPLVTPELTAAMRSMVAGLRTDPVTTAAAVTPGWFGPLVDPLVPRWVAGMLTTAGVGALGVADGVLAYDPRPSLGSVEIPVTFVHGRLDAIPAAPVAECADLTPGARLVMVDQVAHMPHLEVPGWFAGVCLQSAPQ
jgi:pimeloyl-ACP methyl ester carboxylesterase